MDVQILSFDEFMVLHQAILRWPEGSNLSALDLRVQTLLDNKFIEQKGTLYYPTDAGVNHVAPRRLRARKKLN